jgi:hypothetical protein
MENVKEITVTGFSGQEETHIVIEHGNGDFTSMPKAEYDRRQAEQSTPMIPSDE